MATRNRTLIFRKYRDALKSVRVPTSSSPSTSSFGGVGGGGGGPVIELASTSLLNPNRKYAPLSTEDPGNSSKGAFTVGLPPAWVDVSEEIAANVQRARMKMVELAKAHAKALMPSFGDGKEDQRTIEGLTQEITGLLRKSEKQLKRLAAAGPSEDSNVRKNVQCSLATDLQNLSMELRKKQSTYLKRLRQQNEGQDGDDLEMNLNGGRSIIDDDNLDDMQVDRQNLCKKFCEIYVLSEPSTNLFGGSSYVQKHYLNSFVFNEHQMAKLKKSEAFTVEREREIQQASKCSWPFVF
ncbi:hypothetical protein NC651_029610 [Populus alba x Populus x berolinensis]|nr:hypothetical protein NC651_029610 [Populus alba x Populus x berolinensis]